MNNATTLEAALRELARATAVTSILLPILVVILVLLIIVTLVGFWWVAHEVSATNLMLREVLRRTPEEP